MRSVHRDVVVGLLAETVLLAVLGRTAGLGWAGAAIGTAAALATSALLVRALRRSGTRALGPANRVTLARAVLVCGGAALVGDRLLGGSPAAVALVLLAAPALALDAVDGRVARRTGSVSAVGGRFDMELDAFLILVLSVAVVPVVGGWVLGIGAARYAYAALAHAVPWLRGPIPPSPWRKAVAAVQGVALAVVESGLAPTAVAEVLLGASAALLLHSFAGQAWWLARHRATAAAPVPAPLPVPVVAAQRG